MDHERIAVYCGTRNLYPVMEVAAKSLIANTPVDKVLFFLEDDSLPFDVPDIIQCHNISSQSWFDTHGPNYNSTWTYMAFVRLAMAKILPDVHHILYLDTDTIVMKDITPLFDVDLSGKLFAMVREDVHDIQLEICKAFTVLSDTIVSFQSDSERPKYCVRPYCNSGVMMINLDEMRQSGMDDVLINEINTAYHLYPDQDAINMLCADKIVQMPTEYNVIPAICPDFPQDQIRIKHFASDKPLWKSSIWQQYRRMTWETVMERQAKLHE